MTLGPNRVTAQSPAHSPQLGSGVTFPLLDAFSVFVTDKNNSLLSADTATLHQTPQHSRSVGTSSFFWLLFPAEANTSYGLNPC